MVTHCVSDFFVAKTLFEGYIKDNRITTAPTSSDLPLSAEYFDSGHYGMETAVDPVIIKLKGHDMCAGGVYGKKEKTSVTVCLKHHEHADNVRV